MKFCFWGEIGRAFKGQTIGGGELQISLLAKSLARSGHEIVIIDPFAAESFSPEENIKVINVPDWNRGLPFLRNILYRIPQLYRLHVEQNADFYYVRMSSYLHLLSFLAAKKNKAKFIVGLAHDLDVGGFWKKLIYEYIPKFDPVKYLTFQLPNDLVFRYLLKRADCITLQHSGQEIKSFNLKGKQFVFPNIMDCSDVPERKETVENYYACAGSWTMVKGIKNLAKLISITHKDIRYVIVGEPRGRKPVKIYNSLKRYPNVELKGRLGHKETMEIIGRSKALVNTSNFEGFPNIFLEAWAQGVPVISLNVNPGNVIGDHKLGVFCDGNLHEMKDCIEGNKTSEISSCGLVNYVTENHGFKNASANFISIILSMTSCLL